jgi:hypothetical protein
LVPAPAPTNTGSWERSIAIFCACFLLTQKAEIVVFSPARRASRKLLERVIEFVNILGHKPIEFNQEQARMKCYNGEESLIRSFPCAGAARSNDASPCNH